VIQVKKRRSPWSGMDTGTGAGRTRDGRGAEAAVELAGSLVRIVS